MAITRPVTRTIISTNQWGVPVTDEVNRLTDAVAALTPTAWANLSLVNGFVSEAGFAPARYRRNGDVVELGGSVTGVQASGVQMTTLPVGFRPSFTHRLATLCYSGTLNTSVNCRTDITTTGAIAWYDLPAGALFIILTGIRIPLN